MSVAGGDTAVPSEEQAPLRNSNTPPLADQPQTPPFNQTFQAAPSELPFGEQESRPTYFGSLTVDPSLPPNVLIVRPPDVDPELGVCWVCMRVMIWVPL